MEQRILALSQENHLLKSRLESRTAAESLLQAARPDFAALPPQSNTVLHHHRCLHFFFFSGELIFSFSRCSHTSFRRLRLLCRRSPYRRCRRSMARSPQFHCPPYRCFPRRLSSPSCNSVNSRPQFNSRSVAIRRWVEP